MEIKNITLQANTESQVTYSGGDNVWIRNDSNSILYASKSSGIVAGNDGVINIPSKQAALITGALGTICLLGEGSVSLIGTNNSNTSFNLGPSTDGGDADTLGGLRVNEIINNPNIFDNADFKINQRGQNEYSGSETHCLDRWVTQTYGNITITILDSGIRIENTGTNDGIKQLFDENILNEGQIYTLSIEIDGIRHSTRISTTKNSNNNIAVYDGTIYYAAIIFDNTNKLWAVYPFVTYTENCSAVINNAKLELGNIATPFIKPNPTIELLKCQRYYWDSGKGIYGAPGAYSISTADMISLRDGTKAGFCNVKFPAEMRIKPTVTIVSYDGTKNAVSNWASGDTIDGTVIAGSANLSSAGFADVRLPDAITDIIGFHIVASAEL